MTELAPAPNYSVPALEKGLAVRELLARASEPLSLSQISEMTANSASQLSGAMNCLVEGGNVIKDEIGGKYSLTLNRDTAVLIGNPVVGAAAAIAVTQLATSRQSGDSGEVVAALVRCARQINRRAGLTDFAGQPIPVFPEPAIDNTKEHSHARI